MTTEGSGPRMTTLLNCHSSISKRVVWKRLQSLVEVEVNGQVIMRASLETQTVASALREDSDKQVVEEATDYTLG